MPRGGHCRQFRARCRVARKLYLNGGIGSRHDNEGFGPAYELPSRTAYTEVCAAVSFPMWATRMFRLEPDAGCFDVIERTLYNNLGAGGGVVKLVRDADGGVQAEEVWSSRHIENHHGGVVLIDGALYGANGGNGGGYPVCLDWQTGEVLWNERDPDKRRLRKGSVAVADGRIYYRTEEGALVLIEPSKKEYLERGRFEQPARTDKPAWAHPVIANGKLYIRDQGVLLCYEVKANPEI